jgi:8-oxo-dGTP diphosphatase
MLRSRELVFEVADLGTIRSMEQYFLVESKGGPPDRTNWTEPERAAILEHRWWSLEEINATDETVLPVWLPELFESTIVEFRKAKQRGSGERT